MQLRVIAYEDEFISLQGFALYACFFKNNDLQSIHIKALLLKLQLHNPYFIPWSAKTIKLTQLWICFLYSLFIR